MTIENIDQFLNDFQAAKTEQGDTFNSANFGRDYNRGSNRSRTQPEDDDSLNRKGFITETAEALAGGAVDTAELWMRAVRATDPVGGNETIRNFATFGLDAIKNFTAKHPSLSPDNQAQEGVSRWWQQGVRSLMPSMSAAIPGMLAGAVGGPIGASVGGGIASGAIFGLAEYDSVREEGENMIAEKMASGDMTREEAAQVREEIATAAKLSALTEGGMEGIANAVQVKVLSKWFPGRKTLKNLIKAPIKDIFKKGAKEAVKTGAKQLALTTPVEVGTEFAQSALETKFRRDVGLTDMSSWGAGMDALGPAFVTNLLFFGAGKSANAAQRWGIRHALEDAKASPHKRMKAVKDISKIVRGMDDVNAEGIANKMEAVGLSYVASGMKMDINSDLGMETMLEQYRKGVQDKSINNISSKRLQTTLQNEMDREGMPLQNRIPAFQMMQGVTKINEEQSAIDKVRKEEEANKVTKEATPADMLEQNAASATDKNVTVEKTIKVEKEEKPKKDEKPKKKVKITEKAQKDLINVGKDAVVPDATKDAKMEAEREKAKAIAPEPVVSKTVKPSVDKPETVEKPEVTATKLPSTLEKSKPRFGAGARGNFEVEFESDVDKALYIVAKRETLSKADDKFVDFLKAEFPDDTDVEIMARAKGVKKSIGAQIKEDKSLQDVVPFKSSEFSKVKEEPVAVKEATPKKEVKAKDKISKEQERQVRKELKDPELLPDEKADLEKILVDAGLDVTVAKKEAVAEDAPKKEGGVKITGTAPALTGKRKKGEKQSPAQKQELELTKRIGNAMRRLNSSKSSEVKAARKDLKEATIERNKLREDVLSGTVKEEPVTFNAKAVASEVVKAQPQIKGRNTEIGGAALEATIKLEKVRVDEHGIRTVGDSISADMIHKGKVEIVGRTVENERDIATITQMYRNPQYETFRYIFVRERKVVGHRGVTSRLPGSVQVFAEDKQTEVGKIKTQMAELGADSIYIVHNHPSGDPSPSQADTLFTQSLMKAVPEITSHVIINSGKYATLNKFGGANTFKIETDDAILNPSIPNDFIGQRMANPRDVVKIGKELQVAKGYITALYSSTKNTVRGIIEIPLSQTKDVRQLSDRIRENAVQLGSSSAVLTVDTKENPEAVKLQEDFVGMIEKGIVADVIMMNGDQVISIRQAFGISPSKQEGRFIGSEVQTFVEEEKSEFEAEGGKAQKFTDKDFSNNPHVDKATQDIFNNKLSPKVEGATIKERFAEWKKNWWIKLQQGAVDQFASLRKLDDKIWKLAQVTTSSSGAVDALLNMGPLKLTDGVPDIKDIKGNKGLFKIVKPLGEELELWLGWVAGNRAEQLYGEGKERNLTESEIKKLKELNKGTMKDGRSRRSVYRDVWNDFSELHQSVLDVAQETGTIGKEERESWREGFYLPFFRHIEKSQKNETKGPKTLGGIANQTAFKELKGKEVPIADMMTNIILNWNHLVGASLKNQLAVKSLHKAVTMKIQGGQPVAEKINVDIEVVEDESGQFKVIDALTGKSRGAFDTFAEAQEHQEQLTRIIEERLAKKSENAVFVRENGKKVWYEVNEPNIYQALTNLNFEGFNNRPMKALRAFKRLLTFGVTSSPDFKVRNLLRDTLSSAATSKISLDLVGNVFGSGRKSTQRKSEAFMRMMAGGGNIQFGHLYGTDPEKVQAALAMNLRKEGILDNPTGWGKFKTTVLKAKDKWDDFGSRLENLNRAALFSQTLEAKKGEEGAFLEANFEARDLLDFNRHGAWPAVRFLIDTVPFMNARIQGLSKLGRSMTKEQGKRLAIVSGGVAMASMALYLAYKDDPDFQDREEWDRDTYWWFKIPGTDKTFRLPKPFEIGVIGTIAERTLEQITDDKVHGELFAERLKFALTQTFSFDVAPQAIKPVLELMANKSFFTDRPIETLAMENLSPTERRKAWTSETAILLSQGFSKIPWDKVQLSPVQIEHLVGSYTGWLGGWVLGGIDMLTQRVGGFPDKPSFRIEDYTLVGSFLGETPARNTKFSGVFYEGLKEMNQTYADIRNFRSLGETEKALNLARKNKDKLRFRKLANKIQKNIAAISKRVRLTRLDKNMSAQEKRVKIDRLTVMKNKLLKMAVEKTKL